MTTILDVRLASLERHLEEAQDPSGWLLKIKAKDSDPDVVPENLWFFAFDKIQEVVRDLEEEIEDVRGQLRTGDLSEEEAWPRYQRVRARSGTVFRECLDLLGGLALRDRATDDQICQLTDELIRECAQPSFRVLATMPALAEESGDSLTSTLRRVAGVRFPEWTVWTVPLVAHEYAYVMTEVEDILRNYVSAEARMWTAERGHPGGGEEGTEELHAQAVAYGRVLLAEAFATFAMGPAYACATLLLRLDPAAKGHRYRPSDATRARIVLGVLHDMSERAQGAYKDTLDVLRAQWSTLDHLAPAADLDRPEDVMVPDRVAAFLHRAFKHRRTGYTPQGWGQARAWSQSWTDAIQREKRPAVPEVETTHTLRDALNAAWHCRLELLRGPAPEHDPVVEDLAEVGRHLCQTVVLRRSRAARRPVPPAIRARGR
jgi:hypothetical protein